MITTYGERNPEAPGELDSFSFLVGKWSGAGRTRLPDGSHVEWEGATWIGRYVLDGTAIADEFHAQTPDGQSYLGISLRHFDVIHGKWIIEYLNVSHSFLRKQVDRKRGSVSVSADSVTVVSEDAQMRIRERYRVIDGDHFVYSTDSSEDGGLTWGPVQIEMTMARVG